MPDTFGIDTPTARHGANAVRPAADPNTRPAGVPLLGGTALTTPERDALRGLARRLHLVTANIEEAIRDNRADRALQACNDAGALGLAAAGTAAVIGRR